MTNDYESYIIFLRKFGTKRHNNPVLEIIQYGSYIYAIINGSVNVIYHTIRNVFYKHEDYLIGSGSSNILLTKLSNITRKEIHELLLLLSYKSQIIDDDQVLTHLKAYLPFKEEVLQDEPTTDNWIL